MIKVTNSGIAVSGSKVELMAELACIMSSLVDNGFDWDDIDLVVKVAKKSPEELRSEVDRIMGDVLGDFIKSL